MTDPLFSKDDLLVISLGGNAVLPLGKSGTIHQQFDTTRRTMGVVAGLAKAGVRLLLSHGNGPIVGNIVIRNECASHLVTPMPLFICGADSQGGIGFMIQNALQNELHLIGETRQVATVVSQVEVDLADPAFENPSKPIGPFYRPDEARVMEREKGWTLVEDSGRGWRRVVPSPEPLRIVETETIRMMVESGVLVVAAGGGGIPVRRNREGLLKGVDAVVDKDLASTLLALELGATQLVFVTSVARVALDFGKPGQRDLESLSLEELTAQLKAGQFPAGSMGPKMEAARRFLAGGGRRVTVCLPDELGEALKGRAGTTINA